MSRIDATEMMYTAHNTTVLRTGFDAQTRTITRGRIRLCVFLSLLQRAMLHSGRASCVVFPSCGCAM